jgi:hypothetical protein
MSCPVSVACRAAAEQQHQHAAEPRSATTSSTMEGLMDDEQQPMPGTAPDAGQGGPFGDLMSQFQQNRNSGGGGLGAYGGYAPQQQQQQPVMDWGQGFATTQQAALASMTGYGAGLDASAGGDMDADGSGYAKRPRMEDQVLAAAGGHAPHTSSSTNQLQALGNASWQQPGGGLVEGTDLSQVYEQARAQQLQQQAGYHQQQQAGYGAGLMAGYGAGLMDNAYPEAPINQLGAADLMMQQQHMQPGQYNMSAGPSGRARLERLAPGGGYSSRVPAAAPAAQGPARLTTGHKHAEYLSNMVRARFATPAGGAAGSGVVTRSATGSYHGMQQYSSYGYGGGHYTPQHKEDYAAEEADQVLSKCEAVSRAAHCGGCCCCRDELCVLEHRACVSKGLIRGLITHLNRTPCMAWREQGSRACRLMLCHTPCPTLPACRSQPTCARRSAATPQTWWLQPVSLGGCIVGLGRHAGVCPCGPDAALSSSAAILRARAPHPPALLLLLLLLLCLCVRRRGEGCGSSCPAAG